MRVLVSVVVLLCVVSGAEAARWRVTLGSTPCVGTGRPDDFSEGAIIKLRCRGPGKPFRRGSLHLVCAQDVVRFFSMRLLSHRLDVDCTAIVFQYEVGTLACDTQLNGFFAAASFECDAGTPRDVRAVRVR